ncbi:MAG: 2-C-methyl-D-erythritol 4-phosphate cytidylyltransferase [Ruminococcaceae bacterium]|nr:2-C-methyl-D-erythritol 4-phosphate cytidylyltransferase [Oscillospiraceae bacterium]
MIEALNKLDSRLRYEIAEAPQKSVSVIVVAAGSSSRMQGVNKQLLEINSVPVIIKTLLCFEACAAVKSIVLVTRSNDIFEMQRLTQKFGISKLSDIVCGGNSRQESVLNGLERVKSEELVLIHDGARPFVSQSVISRVINALEKCDAVTCAVKLKDTIKQIDKSGKVIKTIDRDSLVSVQTPQGVNAEKYRAALKKVGDVSAFTDDTSIMEAAGYSVCTVEGSYKNIKITTPEDIALAAALEEEE